MIDFHSHILPCIDDGSQSIEESIEMLQMLKAQGCDTVALTSHFLAGDESPQKFLSKRAIAYDKLVNEIEKSDKDLPKLLKGSEVYYYSGITKLDTLSELTLEGTNLLLLEMPMTRWGEFTIRELLEHANCASTQIVIAHIERYISMQKKDIIDRLLDAGILFQVNASFFISRKTRRKALKMLKNGQIHFIGTDCHNLKYRPPRLSEAIDIITDKLGKSFVDEWMDMQESYIV